MPKKSKKRAQKQYRIEEARKESKENRNRKQPLNHAQSNAGTPSAGSTKQGGHSNAMFTLAEKADQKRDKKRASNAKGKKEAKKRAAQRSLKASR